MRVVRRWMNRGSHVDLTRRKVVVAGGFIGIAIGAALLVGAFGLGAIFHERDARLQHDKITAGDIARIAHNQTKPLSRHRLILTLRHCARTPSCRAAFRGLGRQSQLVVVGTVTNPSPRSEASSQTTGSEKSSKPHARTLERQRGPKGPKGSTGAQGPQGPQGSAGASGSSAGSDSGNGNVTVSPGNNPTINVQTPPLPVPSICAPLIGVNCQSGK